MPETEEEKKKRWAAAAAKSYMTPQMMHALNMSKQQSQNKYKASFEQIKGKGLSTTTPEIENAKRMSSLVSKSKYTSDFEKNRTKFTQVADTPENIRLQKLTTQISDNAYKGKELASTKSRRRREKNAALADQKTKATKAEYTKDDAQTEAPAQEQDKPEVREMSDPEPQKQTENPEDDSALNDNYNPPAEVEQHVPEQENVVEESYDQQEDVDKDQKENVAEESYEQQENRPEESYEQQGNVAEVSYEQEAATNEYSQDDYNQHQEEVTGGDYQTSNGYDERSYGNDASYQTEENVYDIAAGEEGYEENQNQEQEPTYDAPPASGDGLDDFYASLG